MLRKGMFISDRYEIIEKVGSGGMSDVYKAKCHKLNRFVAMKVLKPEFSEDKNFVSKFRVEAQSAAGLSHPNIVNVFDVGEDNGIYYIVMELIEGITLKKYIDRKMHLPVKEAVSILIQISQGIEAAHNNHIIHRDIKPQNIIISKEGKVKVTDFGIARAASTNTISSNAMGSVHYISPEQAKGGFIDEKSDIYSLGVTLYEMITGHVPFEGDSTVSIALQHVQNELPSVRLDVPDVPISVEKIIEKCTQKKSDMRYLSISELLADLKKSLITPDEDFVKIVVPDEMGATRQISAEDVKQIRNESGFSRQELDIPILGNEDDEEDYDDEEDDEVTDDMESELEEDDNPKLDKIIAIGGIVTAVIIVIIVAFVVTSLFKNGGGSSTSGGSENTETLDAKHTRVPDVLGLPEEEAIAAIKDATLGYKIKHEYDSKIEKGNVISTSIEVGEIVEKNTTITLVVSDGAKEVEVPDVKEMDKEKAKETLEAAGFHVKTEYQASDTVELDKVISTDPEAFTMGKEGDDITVYVSSGTDTASAIVPSKSKLEKNGKFNEEMAKANLEANGLKLGKVEEAFSEEVSEGAVISLSYETDKKVPKGTAIDVVISKGPKPTESTTKPTEPTKPSESVEKPTPKPVEKKITSTIKKSDLTVPEDVSAGTIDGDLSYVLEVIKENGNTETYPERVFSKYSEFSSYALSETVGDGVTNATIKVYISYIDAEGNTQKEQVLTSKNYEYN